MVVKGGRGGGGGIVGGVGGQREGVGRSVGRFDELLRGRMPSLNVGAVEPLERRGGSFEVRVGSSSDLRKDRGQPVKGGNEKRRLERRATHVSEILEVDSEGRAICSKLHLLDVLSRREVTDPEVSPLVV